MLVFVLLQVACGGNGGGYVSGEIEDLEFTETRK